MTGLPFPWIQLQVAQGWSLLRRSRGEHPGMGMGMGNRCCHLPHHLPHRRRRRLWAHLERLTQHRPARPGRWLATLLHPQLQLQLARAQATANTDLRVGTANMAILKEWVQAWALALALAAQRQCTVTGLTGAKALGLGLVMALAPVWARTVIAAGLVLVLALVLVHPLAWGLTRTTCRITMTWPRLRLAAATAQAQVHVHPILREVPMAALALALALVAHEVVAANVARLATILATPHLHLAATAAMAGAIMTRRVMARLVHLEAMAAMVGTMTILVMAPPAAATLAMAPVPGMAAALRLPKAAPPDA